MKTLNHTNDFKSRPSPFIRKLTNDKNKPPPPKEPVLNSTKSSDGKDAILGVNDDEDIEKTIKVFYMRRHDAPFDNSQTPDIIEFKGEDVEKVKEILDQMGKGRSLRSVLSEDEFNEFKKKLE